MLYPKDVPSLVLRFEETPGSDPVSDSHGESQLNAMNSQGDIKRMWRRFFAPIADFTRRHSNLLWWLHSSYALLIGIIVMWIGSKRFDFLRIVVFYIAFIWLTSLFLPVISNSPRLSEKWRFVLRMVVNYFNKNFYQQLLFFVLPLYFASATLGSRNILFVALVALWAVLATMDVVYDRYLSVRWPLTALFFAFNLFACINLMLPVLWAISNYHALWISAALSLCGFASIAYRGSHRQGTTSTLSVVVASVLFYLLITHLSSFIPPAPMRLASSAFGYSIRGLEISDPIRALRSGGPARVIGLTAIEAPMGLRERVRHRWYLDGRLLYVSPYYDVSGGREGGYRVWTRVSLKNVFQGEMLTLDVETRGGQLIGRASLPTR